MADILSQSEIDALLNALSSGEDVNTDKPGEEEGRGTVREYDFRTANKFYKEQMRTLDVIFENFAFLLANRLTGLLHTLCEIEVSSIEEQKFGEFNNSIATPAILSIVEMEPLQGSMLMAITSTVAYAFVSRLFGGIADYGEESKQFTEIELSVLNNVQYEMMRMMRESWGKIIEVKPKIVKTETSTQFTQITDVNEPSAIVTLNVKIDEIEGMITLCIPHYAIQPVAKELNTVSWTMADVETQGQKQANKKLLEEQIDETEVMLTAAFNDTVAALEDILSLKVGDSILLDHNIRDFITVYVEGRPKFEGVAGVAQNKYVVQVANILKEREEIE